MNHASAFAPPPHLKKLLVWTLKALPTAKLGSSESCSYLQLKDTVYGSL